MASTEPLLALVQSPAIPGAAWSIPANNAPAPHPDAPAVPRLSPRIAPAEQVAPIVIGLSLGGGAQGRISLSLDPVELGRVEVTVQRIGDAARVQVAAERPETLALLARDGASLDRALGGAGVGGEAGRSISFTLLGGDAGSRGQGEGGPGVGQGSGQGSSQGGGQGGSQGAGQGSGQGQPGDGHGGRRQGGPWRGPSPAPAEDPLAQRRALLGLLDIAI